MAADPETLRREALEYPAALLQLSSEMLATIDDAGRVKSLNLAWENALGIPLVELRASPFCGLFHADDREMLRGALQALSRGEVVAPLEARGRRRDGADVWISLRLAALPAYRVYLVAGRDVTELKAERQERNDAGRMSELGFLASLIAHDFNNVLSVILACSCMLRENPALTPEHLRDLDDLSGAVRHGTELVKQVHAFGRAKPLPEDADLNEVVARMDWLLRRLGRGSITVNLALARGLGRVRAEAIQVEQVLLNLALNARDAMPSGGELSIETADIRGAAAFRAIQPPIPPGDYARLSVIDDGRGISPEMEARIFEPFFTTKPGGTGLGLSSVRRIVEQCGGHVRVRRRPGKGTAFEVYFPRP